MKLELLSPAGTLEKLKTAFLFGADAVYAGVPDFSLRSRINDFTFSEMQKGALYAHSRGKKVYGTLNIYPHNHHLKKIGEAIKKYKEAGIDALIISDPGVLQMAKEIAPEMEIHLSTQANCTNWQAAKFWAQQGVKRIILAREVSLEEIKEIHKKLPEVELECFIHGAMCVSYSGRCILSKFLSDRSANQGWCSQPCRWAFEISPLKNSG
ncbi:MAG: peptidase U32 family protein, partial [bacterium]